MYTDPSGNIAISAILGYLGKTAVETIPDVALDILIEGEKFNFFKSAATNFAFNLIPIFGETKTGRKLAKIASKYGDNVVKYLSKYGDEITQYISKKNR